MRKSGKPHFQLSHAFYFCWFEAGGPVTNEFHISLCHSKVVQQFLDLTHLLKWDVATGNGRIRWKAMGGRGGSVRRVEKQTCK